MLIDIKSEEFWQILFDEACVEGGQAERIENELNKISTDEEEIRNKAIDEFVKEIEAEYDNDACPNVTDYLDYKISIRDLFKIAEQMKGEQICQV